MLEKLKIRSKLMVSYAVIVVLTIVITLISIVQLNAANSQMENLAEGAMAVRNLSSDSRIKTNTAARYLRDMALQNDPSTYETNTKEIETLIAEIRQDVEQIKALNVLDADDVEVYSSLMEEWIAIGLRVESALGAELASGTADTTGYTEADRILVEECTPKLEEVAAQARILDSSVEEIQSDVLAESMNSAKFSISLIVGLLVVAIILVLLLSMKVTNAIVKPIEQVKNAAQNLSQGNIKNDLTYSGKDEIGDLVDSFHTTFKVLGAMISDLSRLMHEMSRGNFNIRTEAEQYYVGDFAPLLVSIREMNRTLSATLSKINEASDQVASGSDQVSSGAQALSQGATEQASSVEQLAAAINEINEKVLQTAQHSKTASEQVEKAGEELTLSNERMQELIGAMAEISNSSNEIGKIIKTIEDIAFQTNILALNAAVEAARAGSAGKGFAVVADEVRNLASKSAEAAKNTTSLIEQSITAVENGTKIADNTANALIQTVDSTKVAVDVVDKISQATSEQSISIQEVTQGIDQISSVVQTNSATAEESAAASEELSSQASLLKNLVGKFTLRGDSASISYQEDPQEMAGASDYEGYTSFAGDNSSKY